MELLELVEDHDRPAILRGREVVRQPERLLEPNHSSGSGRVMSPKSRGWAGASATSGDSALATDSTGQIYSNLDARAGSGPASYSNGKVVGTDLLGKVYESKMKDPGTAVTSR